jgi:hypothetical protein
MELKEKGHKNIRAAPSKMISTHFEVLSNLPPTDY